MVYGLLFFILAVVITRVYTTLYKCDDLATITTAPKAIFTFLQGKMSFFLPCNLLICEKMLFSLKF